MTERRNEKSFKYMLVLNYALRFSSFHCIFLSESFSWSNEAKEVKKIIFNYFSKNQTNLQASCVGIILLSIDFLFDNMFIFQNTYLTSQHLLIRGIVEKLMDTDLLAKQVEWKRSIKEIRDIIEKVF